ncbi:MAG: zinc ABC transporter substrate-binding protein [Nevskia sp.]
MRKLLSMAALLAALLPLAPASAASLKVFACEPEWAALTQELGGSNVEIYSATTPLQDPHQVQARPSLIARFRGADLAVCTGAELEIGWFPILFQNGANPRIQPGKPGLFEAYSYITMLEVPTKLDRAEGDIHPYGNPHIQTDPRNIAKIAPALSARLAEIDPAHAADYKTRGEDFGKRWTAAIAKWEQQAAPLKGIPVLSQHKSWGYLYDWLGIRETGTLEPKPGIPPSPAHLQELIDLQKRQPAKLVVYAAYQDSKAADFLAQKIGIPAVKLPFTVAATEDSGDLFKLFDATIAQLLKATR